MNSFDLWNALASIVNINGKLYAKCISFEQSLHFIVDRKYADLVATK